VRASGPNGGPSGVLHPVSTADTRPGPGEPVPPGTDGDPVTPARPRGIPPTGAGGPAAAGAPRDAAPAVLWARYRRPLAIALGCTALLRFMVELVALVSKFGSDFPHVIARTPGAMSSVLDQWDAGIYVYIAIHGYPPGRIGPGTQNVIAFPPMLPFLERVLHVVTGIGYVEAGQAIDLVALVVALVGLHRLVTLDHPDGAADRTVVLTVAWPAAFFLVAGYPESLALALLVWAFVTARSGRWSVAGLLLAAACMSKYYLILAVLPLAYEWWTARRGAEVDPGTWYARAAALVGPPVVTFGAWMIFCAVRFGDPLAFAHAEEGWNRSFAWPWHMVARTGGDLWHLRFLDTSVASTDELVSAVTIVVLVVATVSAFRHLRRSYAVLLALLTAVYGCETLLEGTARESLVAFPLFVVMATWCERHPWLERVLFALFLPTAYYLIERYVDLRFAG